MFGTGLVSKYNKEIKTRKLTNMKQCKVGVEIHFKSRCSATKKRIARSPKKKKDNKKKEGKHSRCGWCVLCIIVAAKISDEVVPHSLKNKKEDYTIGRE